MSQCRLPYSTKLLSFKAHQRGQFDASAKMDSGLN